MYETSSIKSIIKTYVKSQIPLTNVILFDFSFTISRSCKPLETNNYIKSL